MEKQRLCGLVCRESKVVALVGTGEIRGAVGVESGENKVQSLTSG